MNHGARTAWGGINAGVLNIVILASSRRQITRSLAIAAAEDLVASLDAVEYIVVKCVEHVGACVVLILSFLPLIISKGVQVQFGASR